MPGHLEGDAAPEHGPGGDVDAEGQQSHDVLRSLAVEVVEAHRLHVLFSLQCLSANAWTITPSVRGALEEKMTVAVGVSLATV
jgi:hypothetical protein